MKNFLYASAQKKLVGYKIPGNSRALAGHKFLAVHKIATKTPATLDFSHAAGAMLFNTTI